MKRFFVILLVIFISACNQEKVNDVKIEKGCFGFGMAIGLKDISKNRDLNKKDENGQKQIDKLYTYVVQEHPGYVKKFKRTQKEKRKNGVNVDYAIFYLKNDNNDIVSMIAGPIDEKNGRFTILNTATLENERKKGHLKTILRHTFLKLYENNYKVMDVFLESDIEKTIKYTDVDDNVDKSAVIKKLKKVVGENLANPVIKDFKSNKKNFGLLSKITDQIAENLEVKKQNNLTNNFAVANHFVNKYSYIKVAFDDSDVRFDNYYIKPYAIMNDSNVKKVRSHVKKDNRCIVYL